MTRPLPPETRAKISESAKVSQRQRFATPEGKAHQRRMAEAAAFVKTAGWVTPDAFRKWETKMRNAGVPAADRIKAMRDALKQEETGAKP